MNKTIIPVFYTIDDGYAELATVSIKSLIKNASRGYEYNIHVVHQDLSPENIARISALAEPGFNVILDQLGQTMDFITDRSGQKLNNSIWTVSIFFRLFIPDAYPQYDRGIYLDSDTVVTGDIAELFNSDLAGKSIGGCHDLSIAGIPIFTEYIEKGDGVPFAGYINSGVLLMDMAQLRQRGFRDHFLHIFTTYNPATVAPDQDYLNTMLLGDIAYLDRAWDTMPAPGLEPLAEPKLVHYNLFFKPWHGDVDYSDIFWRAAADAGLESHFRALKDAFGPADVAADEAGLNMLLDIAKRITEQGGGLADVFAKEPRMPADATSAATTASSDSSSATANNSTPAEPSA